MLSDKTPPLYLWKLPERRDLLSSTHSAGLLVLQICVLEEVRVGYGLILAHGQILGHGLVFEEVWVGYGLSFGHSQIPVPCR